MKEKTVDARGMLCPKPLILTKQALRESQAGDVLLILLDNATAHENVTRFLKDSGCAPGPATDQGALAIRVEKPVTTAADLQPEEYCRPPQSKGPFVMVINRREMGTGAEDLGRMLMQACLNSLRDISPPPSVLLFYNSGVSLACAESPVLPALQELESRGVKMLVCGTCLDYYALKPTLKAGKVSNMYDIMQTIATAGTVFAP